MSLKVPFKVAVVGSGIIGVSSALRLLELEPETQVTIIAEDNSPNTTGDGSAGFWNPYLLGDISPDVLRFWCEKTFQFLLDIHKSAKAGEYGVGLISSYYLSETSLERPHFTDVYLHYREMDKKELEMFPEKYKYGVYFTTLYAECKKLIPKLMEKFKTKGGKVIKKKLKNLEELIGHFDVVINCPGVGAALLVNDQNVFPIRGQVMRVKAPWVKHAVLGGDDYYILPNTDDIILGGTHQVGNWSREVDPVDSDAIWRGCISLVPSLKGATLTQEWVGLRPGRTRPRLERELLTNQNGKLEVVHNYGHGGSGVTLFWGCALQAADLVQKALNDSQTWNHSKL